MKRLGLFLLAVVMVAGLAGCKKDHDDPYDFNGTWAITYLVVQSNASFAPVGSGFSGNLYITQNGTAIVIQIGTNTPMSGSCDPKRGSFTASGYSHVFQEISGTAEDGDTISGEVTVTTGPYVIRHAFTAQLTSRARSAAGGGARTVVGAVDRSDESRMKAALSMMH